MSPVLFEDPHFENSEYNPWVAYGQSKSANALFAVEADQRLKSRGIRVLSVHPGMIHTDLARYLDEKTIADMMERMKSAPRMQAKTVPAGAATSVWAATAPELEEKGGIYLADCNIAPSAEEREGGYAAHIADTEAAARLWQLTEEALGISFA
jgi:NAD(P)-dependent dehydrogenase (short-subunit alcohol dehydrogenase family)